MRLVFGNGAARFYIHQLRSRLPGFLAKPFDASKDNRNLLTPIFTLHPHRAPRRPPSPLITVEAHRVYSLAKRCHLLLRYSPTRARFPLLLLVRLTVRLPPLFHHSILYPQAPLSPQGTLQSTGRPFPHLKHPLRIVSLRRQPPIYL